MSASWSGRRSAVPAADFSTLNGSILAPGLGAQGAGAADLAEVFGAALPLVLPTMSREVLRGRAGPDALRAAATRAHGCR